MSVHPGRGHGFIGLAELRLLQESLNDVPLMYLSQNPQRPGGLRAGREPGNRGKSGEEWKRCGSLSTPTTHY